MADEEQPGATMLVATSVMRGHKTRIGKISGNINLPRAVEIKTIIGVLSGVIIGLIIVAIIHPTLRSVLYGATFGGAIGYFLVNYSPLQGESMLKWMGLVINTKRQQVKIDGQPVRLAIGTAYLSDPARGAVTILRGAVNVPAAQFDERGVQISKRNRNTPEQLEAKNRSSKTVAKETRGVALDGPASSPLPTDASRSLETKAGRAAAAAASGSGATDTKAGRLAAARAAQAAATGPELDGPAPSDWNGKVGQAAVEVADPFTAPPQRLPADGEVKPRKVEETKQRRIKVPAQGGPKDIDDPFASKPKKLPR